MALNTTAGSFQQSLAKIISLVSEAPKTVKHAATADQVETGDSLLRGITVTAEFLNPDEKTWEDMVRDAEFFLYSVLGGDQRLMEIAIAFAIRVPGLRSWIAPTTPEGDRLKRLVGGKGLDIWTAMRNMCPAGFKMRLSTIVKTKRSELNLALAAQIAAAPGMTLSNMVHQFGTERKIETAYVTPAGPSDYHDAVAYFVEGYWIYKKGKKEGKRPTKHNGTNPLNLERIFKFAFRNTFSYQNGTVATVPPHLLALCTAVVRDAKECDYIAESVSHEKQLGLLMKASDDKEDLVTVVIAQGGKSGGAGGGEGK